MKDELIFVSVKKKNDEYKAYIDIGGFLSSNKNLETELKKVSTIYEDSIVKMSVVKKEIDEFRNNRYPLPARKVWELGDMIFELINNLHKLSFQIDGIYEHLERDLNAKRKWLEKVIIFRRYIPNESMIPKYLNWGKCEKGTRRIAESIQRGIIST